MMHKKIKIVNILSVSGFLLAGNILSGSCQTKTSTNMGPSATSAPAEIWNDIFSCLDGKSIEACRYIPSLHRKEINKYAIEYHLKSHFYPISKEVIPFFRWCCSSPEHYRPVKEKSATINKKFKDDLLKAQANCLKHINYKGNWEGAEKLIEELTTLEGIEIEISEVDHSSMPYGGYNFLSKFVEKLATKPNVAILKINGTTMHCTSPQLNYDLDSLPQLKSITDLTIRNIERERDVTPLGKMPKLKHLCIKKNHGITSKELQTLTTDLKELKKLDITYKDSGISDNIFEEGAIHSLYNLESLEKLRVNKNQFNENGVKIINELAQKNSIEVEWV